MGQSWIQKAEENIELFSNVGRGAEAARMLEITPPNRVLIDRDQAIIMQIGRVMQSRFMSLKPVETRIAVIGTMAVASEKVKGNKYQWIKDIFDGVELHQATIDGRTRADFKEVAIAQGIGMAKQLKGGLEQLAVK